MFHWFLRQSEPFEKCGYGKASPPYGIDSTTRLPACPLTAQRSQARQRIVRTKRPPRVPAARAFAHKPPSRPSGPCALLHGVRPTGQGAESATTGRGSVTPRRVPARRRRYVSDEGGEPRTVSMTFRISSWRKGLATKPQISPSAKAFRTASSSL